MYEFEIISIPKTEPFQANHKMWILAEPNSFLSIKRSDGVNSKTRKIEIPDSIFEGNTFIIGNNCVVSKLLVDAQENSSGNLKIRFTSFSDKEIELLYDFSTFNSLVELLKDGKQRRKLESLSKEKRADEISGLMKLNEEEKTKFLNRIREDLQVFFDLQNFGEFQKIDDWHEDENIENSLLYIEKKMKEVIVARQNLPLFEILRKTG